MPDVSAALHLHQAIRPLCKAPVLLSTHQQRTGLSVATPRDAVTGWCCRGISLCPHCALCMLGRTLCGQGELSGSYLITGSQMSLKDTLNQADCCWTLENFPRAGEMAWWMRCLVISVGGTGRQGNPWTLVASQPSQRPPASGPSERAWVKRKVAIF